MSFGRCRVVVIPYKDSNVGDGGDDDDTTVLTLDQVRNIYNIDPDQLPGSDSEHFPDDPTEDEINAENAADLKREVSAELAAIDAQMLTYKSGSVYDQLAAIRQQIYDLQTLPGTYEEIQAEFERLATQAEPYTSLNFRFE